MGRFGRGGDAPRVVGFDFGPRPVAPPPPPAPEPEPEPTPAPAPAPVATVAPPPPIGTYAPPGYVPYVPPAPLRPMPPPRAAHDAKFKREVTAVVALFGLLVAAGVFVRLRSGPDEAPPVAVAEKPVKVPSLPPLLEDLNAPPTIGGAPRLATRYSRALASGYRTKLPNKGRHAEIEVYGRDTPQYLVVAGDLTKGDANAMFRMVAAKETGIRFGPLRTYAGGVACATMTFSDVRGSLCAWASKVSDGALGGYEQPSPAALAKLTVQVRRDVERGH